jgi:ADP-ribose pyrophosphatase
VRRDEVVRPDGEPGTHCVVQMKPGVSVIALDQDGFVYLTEEFHYAIGRDGIEAVSGGREPGEDPRLTAARELKEELGIRADRWTAVGMVDPFTTIIHSPTALFLAEDLTFGAVSHEGTERIKTIRVRLEEAVEWVFRGVITHAPTAVLLLQIHLRLRGQPCIAPPP